MSFLESPVFWGIVGIIGVAVGIIGTYLPNRKVIKYRVKCTEIITATAAQFPRLVVNLDGKPIQNLILTTITFQNIGYQTIASSDIAQLEPLGAHVSGECFGYILNSSNSNSALTATQTRVDAPEGTHGGCTLNLQFDFLKRKDCLKVSLWHDGAVSVRGELKSGKLKKNDKGKEELISSICLELVYVIIMLLLPGNLVEILGMIQSCDWSVPRSVFGTVLFCILCLLAVVWVILFTVANIQAFYLASK